MPSGVCVTTSRSRIFHLKRVVVSLILVNMEQQVTPEEFTKLLGENVHNRRKELELTQVELADKCGWSQPKIASIEAAKMVLPSDQLANLAESLRTTPASLVSPGNFSPITA